MMAKRVGRRINVVAGHFATVAKAAERVAFVAVLE